MATEKLSSGWKLALSILLCEGIGIASGLLSASGMRGWFESISKPSWNPPNYIFGPVWSLLYLLMGFALWKIWTGPPSPGRSRALGIFALQLFLNFSWSIIFFNFHSPAIAFIDIVLMIITIITMMFMFAPISKTASWLMVPYISWVCFASILNYSIWHLN